MTIYYVGLNIYYSPYTYMPILITKKKPTTTKQKTKKTKQQRKHGLKCTMLQKRDKQNPVKYWKFI